MPVLRRSAGSITGGAIFVAVTLRRTLPWVLALSLALPGAAAAKSSSPWATVNVCDSADSPDTIGIRGSMTGSGSAGEELFMRFQVQFQRADGSWHSIGANGDSGFVDVGGGRARVARQAGRSFRVSPPAAGSVYTLRGLVTFEWRAKNGGVSRRARRRTTGGHRSTAGADPAGFTAAVCTISA
jgi:hypothetical protein